MMATYKAKYRCRLCGDEYYNGTETGSETIVMREISCLAIGVKTNTVQAPTMFGVHNCKYEQRGSFGFSDFVGWEKVGDT